MNPQVDTILEEGCGRCKLVGTPQCRIIIRNLEMKALREIALETASEGLSKLTEQYAASASAIAGIAGEVQGNNFGTEMQKLGQNLGALNNVYELQLKSSQDYLESMNQMTSLQDNIKGIMADLAASAQDTASYRENMAMLSQNLTDLNNVYGNMLRAMRG